MTHTAPRKLILYRNYNPCQNHHTPSLNRNRGRSNPVSEPRPDPDIDEQLRANEHIARRRFMKTKKAMEVNKLPEWLNRKLEQTVLPGLQGIGFDRLVARTLFEITPADWMFMKPVNEKLIVLYPEINHEIREVLRGVACKDSGRNQNLHNPPGFSPAMMTGTIGENPSPEHLFDLLNEIDTSWITLPRTFVFLEKKHAGYLPRYLQTIDGQSRESCQRVFSRITVEFLGNFALKFADGCHSPGRIEKLLFYGYSAMYWKILRQPPPGMENSAVFNSFLSWVGRLAQRSEFLGIDEEQFLYRMRKMKSAVFPTININQPQNDPWNDNARFAVTLRHGSMGAATILKYFGIDQFLGTRQIQGQCPFQSRQNQLCSLLLKIQRNYYLESKRTRRFIRQFISYLKSACEISQSTSRRPQRRFLYRMISNLQIMFNN